MTHVQVQVPFHIEQLLPDENEPGELAERTFPASLVYDSREPYAVRLHLQPPELDGDAVVWTFARDLLRTGCAQFKFAGDGDVKVSKCAPGRVHIELDSRTEIADDPEAGIAIFHIPSLKVKRFLLRSYTQVPAGDEHQHLGDIDREFAELLKGME